MAKNLMYPNVTSPYYSEFVDVGITEGRLKWSINRVTKQ